jgi:hypothetical protein
MVSSVIATPMMPAQSRSDSLTMLFRSTVMSYPVVEVESWLNQERGI